MKNAHLPWQSNRMTSLNGKSFATLLVIALATSDQAASTAEAANSNTPACTPTHHPSSALAPTPFVATTAKPFAQLIDDAMAVMNHGMQSASMNSVPDHDFFSMMIPHHQGAIDMAESVLLHTTDPEVRNLAQGIITEQQNEIRLMEAWLKRDRTPRGTVALPALHKGN